MRSFQPRVSSKPLVSVSAEFLRGGVAPNKAGSDAPKSAKSFALRLYQSKLKSSRLLNIAMSTPKLNVLTVTHVRS